MKNNKIEENGSEKGKQTYGSLVRETVEGF